VVSIWFRTYGFADVVDELLVGAYPLDEDDVKMLGLMRVGRVLNLCEDADYGPGDRDRAAAALESAGIEEHRIGFPDHGDLEPARLEQAVGLVSGWLDEGARVYLHCRAGWERSPTVAAGVVALRQNVDVEEALGYVQARKPAADPLPQQREDLRRWWEEREPAEEEA
jgi:protein-tyrosine phosphatase